MQTRLLDRANDFILRRRQQVSLRLVKRIERHDGSRFNRHVCRSRNSRLGRGRVPRRWRRLSGLRSRRRDHRGCRLPRVAGGLLHLVEPRLNRFRFTHALDPGLECLKRHPVHPRRVMLLHELIVAMEVGRPDQLARHTAAVDDLEITLGRINSDFSAVEKQAEMLRQHMVQGRLFGLERQSIRHRHIKACRSRTPRRIRRAALAVWPAREHHDKPVHFRHYRARNFKKFDRPA